jgi:hypothetical protein
VLTRCIGLTGVVAGMVGVCICMVRKLNENVPKLRMVSEREWPTPLAEGGSGAVCVNSLAMRYAHAWNRLSIT